MGGIPSPVHACPGLTHSSADGNDEAREAANQSSARDEDYSEGKGKGKGKGRRRDEEERRGKGKGRSGKGSEARGRPSRPDSWDEEERWGRGSRDKPKSAERDRPRRPGKGKGRSSDDDRDWRASEEMNGDLGSKRDAGVSWARARRPVE